MADVIRCPHCSELIQYDESDYNLGGDSVCGIAEVYILCPCCGKAITVGIFNID